jgi:hypothetical protein
MAKQQTVSKPAAVPTVAEAEATITRLQESREQVVAARAKAEADTGHHAFAAHARGNIAAVEALDQIAADIARHDARLRELDLALAEAGRILQQARQAETTAANRQRAEEARKLVKELGECFPYLDRKLAEAANALIAIHDGIVKLHQAGFQFPSDGQIRLGVAAIIQTWAHRLPRSWHAQLRDGFEFLAPGRRQTAVEYWRAIEPSLQNTIAQAVDASVPKAPAMQRSDAADRREAAAAAREFLNGGA